MNRSRVGALWFPDWPCHALRLSQGIEGPVATVSNRLIRVCSASARSRGVRRGMKARQAQAMCPELTIADTDEERDARMFTPVVDELDAVAASIEVLRPGLVVVDVGAAERFHGEGATEMLLDAAALTGVDVCVGVAENISTAVIAARAQHVVQNERAFLSSQPIGVLAAEEALGCDPDVVGTFADLGLKTLGDVAALPSTAVQTRFGVPGKRCHDIARGAPERRVAPELANADLSVSVHPEDLLTRVDEAAFMARQLAATLHNRLREAGLACRRLAVHVELEDGKKLERVWRTREELEESATADRVRWQLDGWLSAGGVGAIRSITLVPVEVGQPEEGQLFGQSVGRELVRSVVSRVQSTLGTEAVVQPRCVGGRGVAERIEYIPYGEEHVPVPQHTWPGQLPAPLPARLEHSGLSGAPGAMHPAAQVRVVGADAQDVYVTAEALLSGEPNGLQWGSRRYLITGWAGPWPVDAQWWAGGDPVARIQVVGMDKAGQPRAWLLVWTRRTWRVEATYT